MGEGPTDRAKGIEGRATDLAKKNWLGRGNRSRKSIGGRATTERAKSHSCKDTNGEKLVTSKQIIT